MIKYIRLNQTFDVASIKKEIALQEENNWSLHYNTHNYEGDWTILPLRSINGSVSNILSVHSSADSSANQYKDTEILLACPSIQQVLSFFECEKTSVRLMKLAAGALIKEHRDHELSYEEGEVRFHIPITTNPNVEFILDNERVIMEEGTCWYMNLSLRHKINNGGTADRIHLVIDCIVNDWMRHLFSNSALNQKHIDIENKPRVSNEDKAKIIEQLRLMNTPVSLELALKLEKNEQ